MRLESLSLASLTKRGSQKVHGERGRKSQLGTRHWRASSRVNTRGCAQVDSDLRDPLPETPHPNARYRVKGMSTRDCSATPAGSTCRIARTPAKIRGKSAVSTSAKIVCGAALQQIHLVMCRSGLTSRNATPKPQVFLTSGSRQEVSRTSAFRRWPTSLTPETARLPRPATHTTTCATRATKMLRGIADP